MQENEIKILSVGISVKSKNEILADVCRRMKQNKPTKIFTPNPQMLLKAKKDKKLSSLLNSAQIKLPDGIGVCLGGRILGKKGIKRISGIDLAEDILKLSASKDYSVFLLGSKPGRAERARDNLTKKYPSLNICGVSDGYFQKCGSENEKIKDKINNASPDILFVCFGFPVQEKWIDENLPCLSSVKLAIGLGGSIDVWSGETKRAPASVQSLGLEWLWRALNEPRRMKILLDIPAFLHLVLKQKRALCRCAKRS